MGVRPLAAAGAAAFVAGFVAYTWVTQDGVLADAIARAGARAPAIDAGSAVAETPSAGEARSSAARSDAASLAAGDFFARRWQDAPLEPGSAQSTVRERFALHQTTAALPDSLSSASFDARFGGAASAMQDAVRSFAAAPRHDAARTAAMIPTRAATRAKSAKPAPAAPKRPAKAGFQLASASATQLPLGYASTDSVGGDSGMGSLKGLAPKDSDPMADLDPSHTAIYDITAHTVYLPNGRRLEAHSGLGSHMDDPGSVHMKNTGVTPPNVYDLKLRESLFHGVRAIRLVPRDGAKMYGRAGMLAHSYMLGASGQSNGCVSFSDYAAFLDAYRRGEITRMVVVEHLANAPSPQTAADWLSNALKDIFRRS
jgi:hypothetical protein